MKKKPLSVETEREALCSRINKEIKAWEGYKRTLKNFRDAPQFLEVFSSEEVKNINYCDRVMTEMISHLAQSRDYLSKDISLMSWICKIVQQSEVTRRDFFLFIEGWRADIFKKVKITFGQILFYPLASAKFLLFKYIHKIFWR